MGKKIILAIIAALPLMASAVETPADSLVRTTKAWELGIGGTIFQFSRVGFSSFTKLDDGYRFDMNLNHAVWGAGIYAARELKDHFYIDLQGNIGMTDKSIEGKNKLLFMGGVGLQWRLGEYFGSRYIDPYLRVGANYMYKDFKILYSGNEGLAPDEMSWLMNNYGNKEGRDKTHLCPVALGGGINFWLNDRFGIGLQADYLLMPYKNVANSIQGSARLIWRIGGKTKKPRPVVQYRDVERVVEKIVEKEVIVEKPVEKIVVKDLSDLFANINFEFDSYRLTAESEHILDRISEILKQNANRRYLIVGHTDSRGSESYNEVLSTNRAATVVTALVNRGVPADILKSRGVGKRIAAAHPSTSDEVRRGDRKVTVEIVSNMDYWEYLK